MLLLDLHLVYSELLDLPITLTNQSLHKLLLVHYSSVEHRSIRSYQTGLVLVLSICRVEMDTTYLHLLSPAVVYLLSVVQQRELPSITICLLQMYLVQKIGVFCLKFQLQPKTLLLSWMEIQKHTTTVQFSTEIRRTQRLVLHSYRVLQLQLVSENHPTTQLDLYLDSMVQQSQLLKQTIPLDCSVSLVRQIHRLRSDTFQREFCSAMESVEKQSPSLTIFLLLSHLHQKIMDWSQQMQPAPKIMVL